MKIKKHAVILKKNFLIVIAFLLLALGLLGPKFWKITFPKLIFETDSKIKLILLLKKENNDTLSLTPKEKFIDNSVLAWSKQVIKDAKNGISLPRFFLDKLPNNLNKYESKEKKLLFVSLLLPILVSGNNLIKAERYMIKQAFIKNNKSIIDIYVKKYKVKVNKGFSLQTYSNIDLKNIKEELMLKVNYIPISMMLAQAAMESGWGTSRFAQQGNALFGQWTWKKDLGIKPKENLEAQFSVRSFKNLSDCVNSYLLNLNSHPAYKKMRKYRSIVIESGEPLMGYNTSDYIDRYAEIGFKYVDKIKDLIQKNKFYELENVKIESYKY